MLKPELLTGAISCRLATEDTRVVVADAFSILVPKGMKFSTDQDEIGDDKLLVFFQPCSKYAHYGISDCDSEYTASQASLCIDANSIRRYSGNSSAIDANVRKQFEGIWFSQLEKIGVEAPFVVKSDKSGVIVASGPVVMGTAFFFATLTSGSSVVCFSGKYYIEENYYKITADLAASAYQKAITQWLGDAEIEEKSISTANDFVIEKKDIRNANDFVIEKGVLTAYKGKGGTVNIPEGVTSIGKFAFSGCSGLNSICIPHSVTSIGFRAFSDCTGLTSIGIPSSVTNIEELFVNCTSLTSISIPSSIAIIGDYMFAGCKSLTKIIIPSGVTNIGDYAFEGCTSLTSISIPSSVTSIGFDAFCECDNLTDVYYSGSEA